MPRLLFHQVTERGVPPRHEIQVVVDNDGPLRLRLVCALFPHGGQADALWELNQLGAAGVVFYEFTIPWSQIMPVGVVVVDEDDVYVERLCRVVDEAVPHGVEPVPVSVRWDRQGNLHFFTLQGHLVRPALTSAT